jgi:hypothetical protein
MLEQVRTVDPVPPSRLQRGVPRDLETICLTCLRKEPLRRYATAELLAEDLRRFRAGEPILARTVGRLERSWRWCRRHPAVAAVAIVVALFLVTVAVGSTVAAFWLNHAATVANQARRQAELALADLHASQGLMDADRGRPAEAVLWFASAAPGPS